MGTLEPSRTNEKLRGLTVYRNYGNHGDGVEAVAILVEKVDDEWKVAFDFDPEDQFVYSHSSVGTTCPTSAKWGKHHAHHAHMTFSSSFKVPDITVKCSTDGHPGTGPTGTGQTGPGHKICIEAQENFSLFFLSCDQIIPIVVDCRSG